MPDADPADLRSPHESAAEIVARVAEARAEAMAARAFATDAVLARVSDAFERHGYRTHEFGDSLLLVADRRAAARVSSRRRRAALARPRLSGYAAHDADDPRVRRSA